METKRIFKGKHDELQSRLVSDFIGNTPFVRLSKKVYAKLESVNPGGSIKDRPVKWILDDAEENNLIQKGDTIVEATSGNTGIALAMIGAERNYKIKIVMPCDMSEERKILLEMFGAELIEVGEGDVDEAILLNHDGSVSEGSGENIFMVEGDRITTPAETENCLLGITRDCVFEIAKNEFNYEINSRKIHRSELYLADEIFLTGTAAHITSVGHLDNRPIGRGDIGNITNKLQKKYFEIVRGNNEKYSEWYTKVKIK